MYETKEKLMEAVVKCLPYPDQIKDFDFSKDKSIYLTWRGNRFKVDCGGYVSEVEDTMLVGSDISILFKALLERQYVEDMRKSQK